jgi:hypothetical protein
MVAVYATINSDTTVIIVTIWTTFKFVLEIEHAPVVHIDFKTDCMYGRKLETFRRKTIERAI